MFDIGLAELILLAGLGLIILGPQRLPRVAAQLGRWVGQARRMSRTLMYQLRQEVNLDDPRPFAAGRPSTRAGRAGSVKAKTSAAGEPAQEKDAEEPRKDSGEPAQDASAQAKSSE